MSWLCNNDAHSWASLELNGNDSHTRLVAFDCWCKGHTHVLWQGIVDVVRRLCVVSLAYEGTVLRTLRLG
jgi:hypothetical protein